VTIFTTYILPAACITMLIGASLHDLVSRTIPNGLALLLACAGLVAAIANGHLAGSLIAAASVFAVAFFCWRRGWMGGGDVKLLLSNSFRFQ
jgi:prepilin peptidase CpaA